MLATKASASPVQQIFNSLLLPDPFLKYFRCKLYPSLHKSKYPKPGRRGSEARFLLFLRLDLSLNLGKMSARGGKKKQKIMSKSARAGVLFPVARMLRYLRKDTHHLRIGAGSPVYMAAVIEYLVGEHFWIIYSTCLTLEHG